MLIFLFCLIIAYLMGSISSAIIVSKLLSLPDPRTEGSKNPGATNVLRIGGKKAAALVFLGDALKGFIPVFFARILGIDGFMLGLVAFAAVLGHVFPLYYGFKGGKGVATAFGSILGIAGVLGILFAVIWLITAKISNYSSLSALTAIVLMPMFALVIGKGNLVIPLCLIILTILFTHRGNIQRLRDGTEPHIK